MAKIWQAPAQTSIIFFLFVDDLVASEENVCASVRKGEKIEKFELWATALSPSLTQRSA